MTHWAELPDIAELDDKKGRHTAADKFVESLESGGFDGEI